MSTHTQGGDLKQEIINKHPRRWVDDRIWARAWAMLQDDAKLAMEEYASIKAVAFADMYNDEYDMVKVDVKKIKKK